MYQKSTQQKTDEYCNLIETDENESVLNPRMETLNFIRYFAYAYHVENKLSGKISEFILN